MANRVIVGMELIVTTFGMMIIGSVLTGKSWITMADIKKVINGLKHCTAFNGFHQCQPKVRDDCPYEDEADCKLTLMENVLALLKEWETKQGEFFANWISVNDRLPDKKGDYLIYNTDGIVWPYYYDPSVNEWFNSLGYITDCVTHWMPLPEPPRERIE